MRPPVALPFGIPASAYGTTLQSLLYPPRAARLILSTALAFLVVSGCGQKGALYLPDDPSEMQTLEPAAGEAAAEAPAMEASPDDAEPDESDNDDEADEEATGRPPSEGNSP